MRRALLAFGAVAVVLGSSSAAGASGSPRVALQPAIVRLGHRAAIRVFDSRARLIQVRLAGGTYPDGTLLRWRSLRPGGGGWHGELPVPALRGVYPILLRAPGMRAVRTSSFLRVLEPGTRARPAFPDPVAVVRWWVRTAAHGEVAAVKPWPRPGFDRRDPRLHRLYVVSYSPPGDSRVQDRLGKFVTAFRDSYGAPWQLLEATDEP